jgi:hypothetical protein
MTSTPPEPPAGKSRLRLSRAQRFGLPLMALLPLLAVAGVFGNRDERREAAHGPLLVTARVPSRFRYGERTTVDVSVSNRGASSLSDIRVRIDSAYLDRFIEVAVTPDISPDGVVRLGDLAPHESVRLRATLQGDRAGAHRGIAIVSDAAGDTVRVALASTVFP